MNRGRALLLAQRGTIQVGRLLKRLRPLGPPSEWLTADEVRAWNDVVAVAPDVLRVTDRLFITLLASDLDRWRSGDRDGRLVRSLYRKLGMRLFQCERGGSCYFLKGFRRDSPSR
jgi:hypothetical protein